MKTVFYSIFDQFTKMFKMGYNLPFLLAFLLFTTNNLHSQKTWDGSFDSNWTNAANWTPVGPPVAGQEIIIPSTANNPVIASGITTSAASIEILSGATLTIQANATVNLGSTAKDGIKCAGSVINGGNINIHTVSQMGVRVVSDGNFYTQSNGIVSIDNCGLNGMANYGIVVNEGTMQIGQGSGAIGEHGIFNYDAGFYGLSGNINIHKANKSAIWNESDAGTGLFQNSGNIDIGQTGGSIGEQGIRNVKGEFKNIVGNIYIDNTSLIAILNDGTGADFQNESSIHIGQSSGVTTKGIRNTATFTNHVSAFISVDSTGEEGIRNEATFNNNGTLLIGQTSQIGIWGLVSYDGNFTNSATGSIEIDRTNSDGIIHTKINAPLALFNNYGQIDIGGNGGKINFKGIYNYNEGNFNNFGTIEINNTLDDAIQNDSAYFNNHHEILIGQKAGNIKLRGLFNHRNATFKNFAGALIKIDDTDDIGLYNLDTNTTFQNHGDIQIGETKGMIPSHGLFNALSAVFNNETDGRVIINGVAKQGIVNHSGTEFHNKGKLLLGQTPDTIGQSAIYNEGTFNNEASGEIEIDSSRMGIGNFGIGVFTNKGRIGIGENTGGIRQHGIINNQDAQFINETNGNIHVVRTKILGIGNTGQAFTNKGIMDIGLNGGLIGDHGILNHTQFHSLQLAGINIGNVIGDGIHNSPLDSATLAIFNNAGYIGMAKNSTAVDKQGIYNLNGGIFTNDGFLDIGSADGQINQNGILNHDATFTNNQSILVYKAGNSGIVTRNEANFTNHGMVKLGLDSLGDFGVDIYEDAVFINQIGALLQIDNTDKHGILISEELSFLTNLGTIDIGQTGGQINQHGVFLFNLGKFYNSIGGVMNIDETGQRGINLVGGSELFQFGDLKVGTGSGNIGGAGIWCNNSSLLTLSCSYTGIHARVKIQNGGTVTNNGHFIIDYDGSHDNNGSNFTNNGVLATYPSPNNLGVTNNEVHIQEKNSDCPYIENAFGLAQPLDLTWQGVFVDSACTISAGTYDFNTNQFDPIALSDTTDYFVKISGNSCEYITNWPVVFGDNEPPYSFPQDTLVCNETTVQLDNSGSYLIHHFDVIGDPISLADDNCNRIGFDQVTFTPTSVSCADAGTVVPVVVTVSDYSGNSSQCTAYLTVLPDLPSPITFTGNGNGSTWNDAANWDLNVVPTPCHEVIIPAGYNVNVPATTEGLGKTLEVEVGATLESFQFGVISIGN